MDNTLASIQRWQLHSINTHTIHTCPPKVGFSSAADVKKSTNTVELHLIYPQGAISWLIRIALLLSENYLVLIAFEWRSIIRPTNPRLLHANDALLANSISIFLRFPVISLCIGWLGFGWLAAPQWRLTLTFAQWRWKWSDICHNMTLRPSSLSPFIYPPTNRMMLLWW